MSDKRAQHGKAESSQPSGKGPSEAEVVAWLERHPDLLLRFPDLFARLLPPDQMAGGGNVVDLQKFMVQRLQGELHRANGLRDALLDAGRQNMSITARAHEAVLLLLDAENFEHMVHIATQDWTDLLDVDAISLCVEGDPARIGGIVSGGVFILPPGSIDDLLGPGQATRLRPESGQAPKLYGPAAELVKSDALARLTFGRGAPIGLLALGAREPGKFDPGHGTELLLFLAQVLERAVRRWLQLPKP
ncbi:DUF484 family protein [Ferrovibrio sp.]|uniref:DUF484 family protein n=2 Tax=Ferrovibrio sp. TaxID=1917215 RepID=UPI0035B2BBAA